ncbi:G kinase-anchoring protein 1 [Plakobranchus ocellatus]|uniref:G kinase-anchoring protein 1 n=1 Tax=Plakobranchus ocellatus TaxID=259542 RepID=A0AAV4ACG5_9GAST|nr:G kinase-anchoring protein 1 [Plakobranchus ocellatus]
MMRTSTIMVHYSTLSSASSIYCRYMMFFPLAFKSRPAYCKTRFHEIQEAYFATRKERRFTDLVICGRKFWSSETAVKMAHRQGIAVTNSRFACLKIDDDEEEVKKPSAKQNAQQNTNNASKKRNRKKNNKDADELKKLAFGRGGSGKQQHGQNHGKGDGGDTKDWDQWKAHDMEVVEEKFKDDLAQALLQSRLEEERKQQEEKAQRERIEAGLEPPPTREGRKKKKQKEKPQPMSLEQFKQLPKEKPVGSDDSDEEPRQPQAPPIQTRVPVTEQDPQFFSSVDNDAQHIVRHEKIQEEYRKQYASDNAVVAKLKNDIEQRDQQLAELKSNMDNMESELKQVKKRNKQLCVILAQGEMKDKAQVLLQVDELTVVKDELTEQITNLTAELEKEKSKNRSLKAEIDKMKVRVGSKTLRYKNETRGWCLGNIGLVDLRLDLAQRGGLCRVL